MKTLKLDENFPFSATKIFAEKGIDASSVFAQQLCGTDDANLLEICKEEGRILVTFDLDFANIIRFKLDESPGIIICRFKRQVNFEFILHQCLRITEVVTNTDVNGKLLIIDEKRIRIRKPDDQQNT